MIAVKMETIMKTELDGVGRLMASRFCEFAEAKIKIGSKTTRYNKKKLQEAADFVCEHPAAIDKFRTISEAKKDYHKESSSCQSATNHIKTP